MTLEQFISKYSGIKKVGNTAENKGECVGLAMVYIEELGLSHIWGHAKDIFANALETEHTKIKNSPSAYPIRGDIITWNKTMGGGFGHIAIVLFADEASDSFTVFEQNNPLGSTPKLTTYKTWKGVIGWLRPLKQLEDPFIDTTRLAAELATLRTANTDLGEIYKKATASRDEQITDLSIQLERLKSELAEQQAAWNENNKVAMEKIKNLKKEAIGELTTSELIEVLLGRLPEIIKAILKRRGEIDEKK